MARIGGRHPAGCRGEHDPPILDPTALGFGGFLWLRGLNKNEMAKLWCFSPGMSSDFFIGRSNVVSAFGTTDLEKVFLDLEPQLT